MLILHEILLTIISLLHREPSQKINILPNSPVLTKMPLQMGMSVVRVLVVLSLTLLIS